MTDRLQKPHVRFKSVHHHIERIVKIFVRVRDLAQPLGKIKVFFSNIRSSRPQKTYEQFQNRCRQKLESLFYIYEKNEHQSNSWTSFIREKNGSNANLDSIFKLVSEIFNFNVSSSQNSWISFSILSLKIKLNRQKKVFSFVAKHQFVWKIFIIYSWWIFTVDIFEAYSGSYAGNEDHNSKHSASNRDLKMWNSESADIELLSFVVRVSAIEWSWTSSRASQQSMSDKILYSRKSWIASSFIWTGNSASSHGLT